MPLEIAEIDHVVLRVTDVGRAIRFYSEVLGCAEERRIEELGLYQLRAGRALIDLVDVSAPLGHAGGRAPGIEASRGGTHRAAVPVDSPHGTS